MTRRERAERAARVRDLPIAEAVVAALLALFLAALLLDCASGGGHGPTPRPPAVHVFPVRVFCAACEGQTGELWVEGLEPPDAATNRTYQRRWCETVRDAEHQLAGVRWLLDPRFIVATESPTDHGHFSGRGTFTDPRTSAVRDVLRVVVTSGPTPAEPDRVRGGSLQHEVGDHAACYRARGSILPADAGWCDEAGHDVGAGAVRCLDGRASASCATGPVPGPPLVPDCRRHPVRP